MSKDDMNKEETIRSVNGEIISSGVDRTERDSGGIISSGVGQVPTPAISLNEIVINGERYIITQQLATSGEAEVFLAKRGNDEYVIKLYYPSFTPKKEIIEKLKGLTHPDIISIIDYGWYQNRFVEVMEYARGGSLYEKIPIKDPKFLKQIVKEVVNALEFCHSRGIIHRDLKPQNIFFRDSSQRDIVIGDFGISSVLEEGYSKRLTGQARTLTYAAPELFQSIKGKTVIDKEVDYYSLGITLIHLWSGEEPFKDLGEYGVMRMKMDGRVEIPEDMPNEFKTLIKGLLVVNPAKRWGYKEVQKWLNGEVVPVEYEVIKEYPPFIFRKVGKEELVATDPESLADLMERHKELGKRHLYRRAISEWLKNRNQYLYTAIESIIEEEYPRDQRAGLIKAIYVLDSGRGFKGVDGNRYSTPEEIAKCLEENFSYYEEELKKETAELYLYLEARGYKGEADKFRKLFKSVPSEAALNTLILSLEGGNVLKINGHVFQKYEELLNAPEPILQKLVKDLANPYSKFSLWLQRYSELDQSVKIWRSLKRYDTLSLRYALNSGVVLDKYILKEPEDIRDFLLKYPDLFNRKDVEEVNYYLRYYRNISFNELVLNVAKQIEEEKIFPLVLCAFYNYDDLNLDIFQTTVEIYKVLKTRGIVLDSSSQIFPKLASEVALTINKTFQKVGQNGYSQLLLENWIKALEIQEDSYKNFWKEVLSYLPRDLFIPCLISIIEENKRKKDIYLLISFADTYQQLKNIIISLEVSGPLLEKLIKEEEFIKIEKEKKEKEIESEYESQKRNIESYYMGLVEQRRKNAEAEYSKLIENIKGIKIAIILLLIADIGVIFPQLGNGFQFIAVWVLSIIGIVFYFYFLVILFKKINIGCLVGIIFFPLLLPLLLIALLFFPIYGWWFILDYKKEYNRAIESAAKLTFEEESALNKALLELDERYKEKKNFEFAIIVLRAISKV